MLSAVALVLSLQAADLEKLTEQFEAEKTHPSVRREKTIAAIGALKSDEAAEFLTGIFDSEDHLMVRGYVIEALVACEVEKAMAKLDAIAADTTVLETYRIPALRAVMKAKRPGGLDAAKKAVREFGEIKLEAYLLLEGYPLEDTEAMWRAALNDDEEIVVGRALVMLARLKDKKLIERAKKAVLDPLADTYVKYGSVAVLEAAGGLQIALILFTSIESSDDPTYNRLVAEALGATKSESVAKEIFARLRHKDERVRAVCVGALGLLDHKRAMSRLTPSLRDKSMNVRLVTLSSIARRKDPGSEKILHREAQKSTAETGALALALLEQYPSEETRSLLAKLGGSYKPELAIPALDTLAKIAVPEDLPVFEKALGARKWPVRVTAIRGLARIKTKDSIGLIVERMEKEEGRMLAECAKALETLTGKSLGYTATAWKAWWDANRASFSFDASPEVGISGRVGATTYHGVPVLSTRIVFCLDMSGSMSAEIDGETRMEQAKKELSRVLGVLGNDARVNLIFFDDQITPWQRGLAPIKSNLKRALATVKQVNPRGTTNIYDTLELAFQHADADTIYLLSDGDPTDGKVIDSADILAAVGRLNRTRQIVIHTISFGPSEFMKLLAEQNGGEYVEVK